MAVDDISARAYLETHQAYFVGKQERAAKHCSSMPLGFSKNVKI